MVTIVSRSPRRAITAALPGVRIPLWLAVVCSRIIVLAAGTTGSLLSGRIHGWGQFDPTRLSTGLGSVGNVLGASVLRWDGIRYATIAQHGYQTARSTVSYPLYSLLIHIVSWVLPSAVIAGVLISTVSFTIGLLLVHRIASEELGPRVADSTVLLLAFAPLSFYFTAVYTESLFLALTVGSFYLARRQRFALACVAAAGASLTHIEGVLLVAPLALMYWRSRGSTFELRRLWSWSVTLLALPPLAIAGFFAYLHTQGYGWMAPVTNANAANYGRTMVGPFVMVYRAISDAAIGLQQTLAGVKPISPAIGDPFNPGFQNLIYLGVLVIAVLALVSVWRRLPKEYALYATLVMVVCTSSAVAALPLEAFDRYMLPIFPLWIGAAAWIEKRRLLPTVLTISTLMLIFYVVMFSRWVFVG
jgi:hypothetical protein